MSENYRKFLASKLDLESYFNAQILLLTPKKDKWFIHESRKIYKPIVLIPQRYKRTETNRRSECISFFSYINWQEIHSKHPLEIHDKDKLPFYLKYNFALHECFDNEISIEYYKLAPHKMKKFLVGYNSNSVPGKCIKWETKLKIGVLEEKYFWIPSSNLIMNQIYCSQDNCLVSNYFPSLNQRHEQFCSNEQKIHTKQKSYGDQSQDLDQIIDQKYLPKSFKNYRARQFAVFDIECLENKINTVAPEYGFNILANQSVCSIGEFIHQDSCFKCVYSCGFKCHRFRSKMFCAKIVSS